MTTPSKVAHALTRVCLELRHKAGIELVHLAAREYGRNVTRGHRREVSVLLLVPDPDTSEGGIGHICMAEMLVHLDASTNELENVASRFWYDWEDWTVPQYSDYVKDLNAEPLKVRIPDKRANVPWSTVMDSLLEAVQKVTRCIVDSASFKALVKRISEELKVSDLQERVYEWQVEKVWSKGPHRRTFPVIRIAFKVMQGRSYREDPGAVMLMELEVESKKTRGCEESNNKPMRKVNNMSVVYDGGWPIFHHYRTDIPPPSLEDLIAIEKR
ncbi:hypothetical protein B9479_001547 [Cryptococcus floricola]|uniref:Uncharacterized protein n=1 Tax=Cryptococcus floricola TaxID=2591691 RepID=A0A5D3B683_9TREE|nr:hypothetical protein B9479_001547 [Cryptococcus floricola]